MQSAGRLFKPDYRVMTAPAVHLVRYDSTWPAAFEAEAARIESVCAGLPIRLEHIGSTSVPGLAAKPVIDILAGRPPRSRVEPYIDALRQLGYEHKGSFGVPGREYFRRGSPRSHHVHLFVWDSAHWRDHLLFRDHLRAHPELAREYEALKYELAVRFAYDRKLYTDEKGPFIKRVLREAKMEPGS
jgi:GrpB-like predicted nucleotidyltransferase (UPF0157 family)